MHINRFFYIFVLFSFYIYGAFAECSLMSSNDLRKYVTSFENSATYDEYLITSSSAAETMESWYRRISDTGNDEKVVYYCNGRVNRPTQACVTEDKVYYSGVTSTNWKWGSTQNLLDNQKILFICKNGTDGAGSQGSWQWRGNIISEYCTETDKTKYTEVTNIINDSNIKIYNKDSEYCLNFRKPSGSISVEIEITYEQLLSKTESMFAKYGITDSVWRNSEGKFNTARLASDSVAGVVLGTAGGLITSTLVKKKQVKDGFEDIGCYSGGQKIADYGDEFSVGRQ